MTEYKTHITTSDLAGACEEQHKLFQEKFGGKAKITNRNMARAIAWGLDVFWLERLIPAPAWADYERVKALALADYERVKALAWADYERVKALAWADYERVTAPALVKALTGIAA